MTAPPPLPHDTATFLKALSGAGPAALAASLGLERLPPIEAAVAVVEDLGGRRETVERVRQRLSPEAFQLLLRWVVEGPAASWWTDRSDGGTAGGARADASWQGRDEVIASGVATLKGDRILVLPALATAVRDEAERLALGPPPAFGADVASFELALAIVACALATERPALTRSGDVHATAAKRVAKRLGGTSVFGWRYEQVELFARRLDVVVPEAEGDKSVLAASAAGAAAFYGRPAGERAMLLLAASGGADRSARVLAALRACGTADGGASLAQVLETAGRAVDGAWRGRDPVDGWRCAQMLRTIEALGLAERVADANRFRPRAPTEPLGAFVVQPSLEVLVPWDAPGGDVVRLGLVAELVAVDRVCRFRLARDAAERGLAALGSADAVVAAVRGGRGVVPPNVEATVRGWVEGPRAVRPYRGDVLVVHDPAQRRALAAAVERGTIGPVDEIARGVFLLVRRDVVDAVHVLRAAGVRVDPIRRTDEDPRQRAPRDLGRELADIEASVHRFAETIARKPASAEKRPEAGGPTGGQATSERVAARAPSRGARPLDGPFAPADLAQIARTLGLPEALVRELAGDDAPTAQGPLMLHILRRLDELAASEDAGLGRGRRAARETSPTKRAREADATAKPRKTGRPSRKPVERPWTTMLPGALVGHFRVCAAEQRPVEIVYVNSQGRRVEHTVVPVDVRRDGARELLDARDAFSGGLASYRIDQVMAVRDA